MHQQHQADQGQEFGGKVPQRDMLHLLQALVQPQGKEQIAHDGDKCDQIQIQVRPQFRYRQDDDAKSRETNQSQQ